MKEENIKEYKISNTYSTDFSSFVKNVIFQIHKLFYFYDLRRKFKCSNEALRSLYINMGQKHLEFKPNRGFFLFHAHKIMSAEVPYITLISKDIKDYESIKNNLSHGNFFIRCFAKDYLQAFEDMALDETFDSVSLPFVLDTFENYTELSKFLTMLKNYIHKDTFIFGFINSKNIASFKDFKLVLLHTFPKSKFYRTGNCIIFSHFLKKKK